MTRRPILLRWTEEAEAERVCALAILEGEPQDAAARPAAIAAKPCSTRRRPTLLPSLLNWFGGAGAQIARDDDPRELLS